MQAAKALKSIMLVLTSQCNLRCAYCFENAKGPGRMEWKILKAALDLALKHGRRRTRIVFYGGEPLLEFDLTRKAIAYAERARAKHKRVSFTIVTNGTLLTGNRIAFLAKHSVNTQLSFDGVSPAQDLRGRGTFAYLDKLLERTRRKYPDFYKRNVRINMTVVPQTVRYVADSFEYFLRRNVRGIAIAPFIADCSSWKADRIEQFEKEFVRIYKMSLAHFEQTGEIPLVLFHPDEGWPLRPENSRTRSRRRTSVTEPLRRTSATVGAKAKSGSTAVSLRRRDRIPGGRLCSAGRGESLAVDVDGEVYPCVTLAGSYQTVTSSVLDKSIRAMSLGNLTGREFWKRYHGLPEIASRLKVFASREKQHSSYRMCRKCRYFAECFVCPAAVGRLPGNDSCERVPDFTCAFNFTAFKYRELFLKQISPG